MADDVSITPGSGANIATDKIGGRHFQVFKHAVGVDGEATLVSMADPMPIAGYGELIEAIEAQRFALHTLTRTIGQSMPDVAGRLRVNVEAIATIAAITTLTTLTNQTNVGGLSATEQIPSLMRVAADSLRRNISVT
jgi:hypothetical protein